MQSANRIGRVFLVAGALGLAALGAKWLVGSARLAYPGGAAKPAGSASRLRPGGADRSGGAGGGVLVHVAGLVRKPGVYRLGLGARTYEALKAAGGAVGRGDPNALQLAARVADGSRILVPPKSVPGKAPASGSVTDGGDGSGGGPVSLSSATVEQLDSLDGIGPALARRIVEWRTAHGGFGSVDELDRVPGIGPAKFAALKDAVVP